MSLSIRIATLADEPAVLTLIEELFDPPGQRPRDYTRDRGAAAFHHAVEAPGTDVLLAVDGGTIVGLASVYVDLLAIRFGPRCWLEDLVVTEHRRGAGVGRLLLEAAADWGRRHGCSHLQLNSATARREAHRFYLANGMKQASLTFQLQL